MVSFNVTPDEKMISHKYERNFGLCTRVYLDQDAAWTGQHGGVRVWTSQLGLLDVSGEKLPKYRDVVVAFRVGGSHHCRIVERPDKLVLDWLSDCPIEADAETA